MNKLLQIGIWLILGIAFGLICLFSFWLYYPYKILEIKGDVFPVVNKTVKQGGVIYFISDNCKYVDLPSSTSRTFVNNIIFYVPLTITNVRKGCGKVTISVPISKDLPLGRYHLHNIFQYKVNPIRVITIEHDTEEFTIIE